MIVKNMQKIRHVDSGKRRKHLELIHRQTIRTTKVQTAKTSREEK